MRNAVNAAIKHEKRTYMAYSAENKCAKELRRHLRRLRLGVHRGRGSTNLLPDQRDDLDAINTFFRDFVHYLNISNVIKSYY